MAVTELQRNLVERVCVGDLTARSAGRFPEHVAVTEADTALTYTELDERANRIGNALLGLGLQHQQVVAFMIRNRWELLAAYFGCAKAGLIAAPMNLGLGGEEIAYCLNDCGARVLLAEPVFADQVAGFADELEALERVVWIGGLPQRDVAVTQDSFDSLLESGSPDPVEVVVRDRDSVQLLYTSGTTSHPKGVLTSHLAVTIAALSAALQNHFDHRDGIQIVLPLFHCAALDSIAMPTLLSGAKIALRMEFDPVECIDQVEREGLTFVFFLPMMYQALIQHPEVRRRDLSQVRMACYAMAPMADETMAGIREIFPNADVLLGSGQTEFTPPTVFQRREHQWNKAASWGPATASTEVAIMDDDGRLLPPGEVGEIVYRGPQVMTGYLNLPERTDESFAHGWFHSGDVGYMDDERVVWFTDRKKDMVKTGGENVASVEVERCLLGHPAVAEAAVIGVPDERWGEAVTAVVVLDEGAEASEAEIIEHCKQRLAGFKVPKAVRFVADFPRTGTGKIQKHLLR